jgi:hypothetical protein
LLLDEGIQKGQEALKKFQDNKNEKIWEDTKTNK